MRCDFCGEEVEGQPFYKDGMNFCSLECSDAMEGGETIPLGEDVLDDPDEVEEDELEAMDDDDKDKYDIAFEEDFIDGDLLDGDCRY